MSISLFTFLLGPPAAVMFWLVSSHRPRLSASSHPPTHHHSLRSPPPLPPVPAPDFLSTLTSPVPFFFSFSSTAGTRRPEGVRDVERGKKKRVRGGTLSSSELYKAISVPVKAPPSPPPSVLLTLCLVSKVFIQPGIVSSRLIFGEKTRRAECGSLHSCEDSGSGPK